MALTDLFNQQTSFLFRNAGDSVFSIAGTGMAAMVVDTVDNESHDWQNEISQYPVEGLKDISDNIKPKPDELAITAFISNTPVHGLVDEVINFADRLLNGRKRAQEAFNQLKALREKKEPVTVTTRYRVYPNMGISSITVRRVPDEGDALIMELRFKEIRVVSTQTTKVPAGLGAPGKQADNATKQRAGVTTDAGKSVGKVAKPGAPEVPQRVNKSLAAALGSFF
ncbi:hypothetical protein CUW27_20770 [Salmonella enterica]|nr:hypothetical protein [Salmonella enterica]